jgi:hypothetical protein
LFYRSGWTQLGRFLNFLTDVRNPESGPHNFTERRFRLIQILARLVLSPQRGLLVSPLEFADLRVTMTEQVASHAFDRFIERQAVFLSDAPGGIHGAF